MFRLEKNFPKALQDYETLLQKDPQYFSAYLERGKLYLRLKRTTEALQDFLVLWKKQPHLCPIYELAVLQIQAGQHYDVIEVFKKGLILEKNPESSKKLLTLFLEFLFQKAFDAPSEKTVEFLQLYLEYAPLEDPRKIPVQDALKHLEKK